MLNASIDRTVRRRTTNMKHTVATFKYVVDTVSRDGEHKCCQVWIYDKRPANGAGESSMLITTL